MTEDEKQKLIIDLANAKQRCRESYGTMMQLKKLYEQYQRDWMRWKNRYEAIDRTLANEEKVQVIKDARRKREEPKLIEMSQEQILALANSLGVKVEFKGGK